MRYPNNVSTKEDLKASHPGVCKKVHVENEHKTYAFFKKGEVLPPGEQVIASHIEGTWVEMLA